MQFHAALFVLVLAPEAYLPLRALGANFHASADGMKAAEQIFELLETSRRRRRQCRRRHAAARRTPASASAGSRSPTPAGGFPPSTVPTSWSSPERSSRSPARAAAASRPCSPSSSGLRRPDSGSVLLGGVDLRDLDLDDWRAASAGCPSGPHLFARTVAENVRLGRPDASDAEVAAALDAAGPGRRRCAACPEAWTPCSATGGAGLSAGERQRLALARAFVRDAPLLVLDEPTASLDAETEAEVLDAVRRLTEGRTALVVAHRPALAALADRVVDLPAPLGGAMSGTVFEPAPDRPASVGRTLGIARAARGDGWPRPRCSGAGAIGASIALMGTSAWLISRAAQHPSEASLTLAIVGVQFFGLSRGFLRYGERLVGHDAALRVLGDLRVRVYEQLEASPPPGCPLFRRGDLVARVVDDVDSLQDVVLRVDPALRGRRPGRRPARSPSCGGPAPGRRRRAAGRARRLGHRGAVAHRPAGPAGGGPAGRGARRARARRWSTSMEGAAELIVMGGTARAARAHRAGGPPAARHWPARARAPPASASA